MRIRGRMRGILRAGGKLRRTGKPHGKLDLRQLRDWLYDIGFVDIVRWWPMSEHVVSMRDEKQPRRWAKASPWRWLGAWSAMALGAGTFASGCGVSADEICEIKCGCEGCSQEQRDDCIADVETTTSKAEDLGCSTQYADWLQCVEEEAECRNGDTFAWDGCDIEEDALEECGGGNPCDAAAKKLCDECKFSCTDPSTCDERNACLSTCVVNATCEEIATSSSAYSNCVGACF